MASSIERAALQRAGSGSIRRCDGSAIGSENPLSQSPPLSLPRHSFAKNLVDSAQVPLAFGFEPIQDFVVDPK
jgi:hypothetical protein